MPLLKYNSPQSLGRKRLIFCPWAITGVCLHSGITGEPRYGRAQLELITPSGGSIKGRRDQVVGQAPWAKGAAYYKELIYLCNSLFSPVMWNLFNFPHYPFPPSPPPPQPERAFFSILHWLPWPVTLLRLILSHHFCSVLRVLVCPIISILEAF